MTISAWSEKQQQIAMVLDGATTAMIFHVVVLDPEAAQQAAMANGGSSSAPAPQLGPVVLPPPSPPAGGAVAAQEFRRVCTPANLATCVPACNVVTYGFLLSIEIDSKGTVRRAAAIPLSAHPPPPSSHESH